MLTIEPRMFNMFCTHSPIYVKHIMPFWCQFFDPHLTTYHSNTVVQIIVMLKLGRTLDLYVL